MARGTLIAGLVLSLGMSVGFGLAAQGTASGPVASVEGTVTEAGKTATREITDAWLTLQMKLALFADERVNSRDVHVTTQTGVITLRGKVDSEAEQQAAEEIARTIEGAREVNNQLAVVPRAERKAVERQDDQIVKDVKREIKSDTGLKKARIHVRADQGIVTLTGKAPSLEASVRASEAARRVSGVRAVRNELAL